MKKQGDDTAHRHSEYHTNCGIRYMCIAVFLSPFPSLSLPTACTLQKARQPPTLPAWLEFTTVAVLIVLPDVHHDPALKRSHRHIALIGDLRCSKDTHTTHTHSCPFYYRVWNATRMNDMPLSVGMQVD